MSIFNNSFVAAAATALGLNVTAGELPIAESLLNDVTVSTMGAAEVTDKGKCIVLVTTKNGADADVVRPVADASGNVKLYANGAAVVALAKRSNLPGGESIAIVKKTVITPVGDPIAQLKSKHKSAVKESEQAAKPLADLGQKKTGAEALGWNTDPVGSATRAEYDDIVARKATVQEWKDKTDARVATLAAALTAAGISPVTYLPI